MNVPEMKMAWENEKRKNQKQRIKGSFQQQQKVENAVYSLIFFLVGSKKTRHAFSDMESRQTQDAQARKD